MAAIICMVAILLQELDKQEELKSKQRTSVICATTSVPPIAHYPATLLDNMVN